MNDAMIDDAREYQSAGLPGWWRFALIATATIVLCSCSAPAIESALPVETPPAQVAPLPVKERVSLKGVSAEDLQADPTLSCPTCQSCACCGDAYGKSGAVVGPTDEYLCDGGDFGTPAGVRADWKVEGVEEEDAIGHYDTVDGRVIVVPSNRVCIYSPRFAAIRRVVSPIAHEQPEFINVMFDENSPARAAESLPVVTNKQRHALAIDQVKLPPSLYRQRQQAGGLENLQAAMDAYSSLGAYANLTIIRTGEVSDAEKPLLEKSIESAVTLTGNQAPQVVIGVKQAHAMVGIRQPGIVYQTDEPDHPRLRLLKLASCGHALPGEIIEFTLRFDNIGDQVIGNVTVVDNLSKRFEYVSGSAKSSVDADFLTDPDASGSTVLRWEVKAPVEPGEGGILRFRVKVR